MFQEAGYHTAITGWPNKGRDSGGKTDYISSGIAACTTILTGASVRPASLLRPDPFARRRHRGGDIEQSRQFAQRMKELFGESVDPAKVTLPPYYPDHPVLREDWAAYLDSVKLTDKFVGDIVARLRSEGTGEHSGRFHDRSWD